MTIDLRLGDCLNIMRGMDSESVDVVITSPPYNMGLTPGGNGRGMYRMSKNCKASRFHDEGDSYFDAMSIGNYNSWQRIVLAECWRLIKPSGAIYYNHRPRIEHGKIRLPLDFDFGLPLRQIITWDRSTGIGVNLRHYCSAYEWVLLFAKPDFMLVNHAASGQSDMWRLGMEHSETGHPAPFPVSLPVKILETVSNAETALDPFMGSGTTALACLKLNRNFVGIEISQRYFNIAKKRIEDAQMQLRMFDYASPGHCGDA